MATDSFTSSAAAVATPSATLLDGFGVRVYTRRGWYINCGKAGLYLTKASSFGGSQSAVSFPVTLDDARDLANELLKAVT